MSLPRISREFDSPKPHKSAGPNAKAFGPLPFVLAWENRKSEPGVPFGAGETGLTALTRIGAKRTIVVSDW